MWLGPVGHDSLEPLRKELGLHCHEPDSKESCGHDEIAAAAATPDMRVTPRPPQAIGPERSYELSMTDDELAGLSCFTPPSLPLSLTALCSLPMLTGPSDEVGPSPRWCCAELANRLLSPRGISLWSHQVS